jgi:hypothetical protein
MAHKRIELIVFIGALVIAGAGGIGAQAWKAKSEQWAAKTEKADADLHNDMPLLYEVGLDCDTWTRSSEVVPCFFGPKDAPKAAVLFGDSVAAQWFSAFAQIYSKNGWNIFFITKSGCPMVDEPIYYARFKTMYTVCDIWRAKAIQLIAEAKPDLIIMSSAANYSYSLEQWAEGSRRVIEPLAQASKEVMVLRSTPALPIDMSVCQLRKAWQPKWIAKLSKCETSPDIKRDNDVWTALHTAAEGFPNVKMVDLTELACPDGKCVAHNGQYNVFIDDIHLTNSYVMSITGKVEEAILTIDQAN